MPKRDHYIFVCTNRRPDGHPKGSCAEAGSEKIQLALKAAVNRAGLQDSVRVMSSSCQDLCWRAPTLVITPEMTFLGKLTEDDVPTIVQALVDKQPLASVSSLAGKVVQEAQFNDPDLTVALRRKP